MLVNVSFQPVYFCKYRAERQQTFLNLKYETSYRKTLLQAMLHCVEKKERCKVGVVLMLNR